MDLQMSSNESIADVERKLKSTLKKIKFGNALERVKRRKKQRKVVDVEEIKSEHDQEQLEMMQMYERRKEREKRKLRNKQNDQMEIEEEDDDMMIEEEEEIDLAQLATEEKQVLAWKQAVEDLDIVFLTTHGHQEIPSKDIPLKDLMASQSNKKGTASNATMRKLMQRYNSTLPLTFIIRDRKNSLLAEESMLLSQNDVNPLTMSYYTALITNDHEFLSLQCPWTSSSDEQASHEGAVTCANVLKAMNLMLTDC